MAMSEVVKRGAILPLMILLIAAGDARAASTPCWLDQGALVVSASFGDLAGDFIVETASPISQLNETEASAAGLEGGNQRALLRLAGRRIRRARFAVAKLDYLPQTDTAILGVIGEDLLSRYEMWIDFKPCRITLARRLPPGSGVILPVGRVQGVPTVRATYADGESGRTESMAVSTGRWESLIPRASLSRAPKPGGRAPIRLRSLWVADSRIEQAPAALADGPVGTIGASIWTRWRALRLSRSALTLTP